MKWIDTPQEGLLWQTLRSTIPTASDFAKILTPGGKLSAQSDSVMAVKLYSWMVGVPYLEREPTKWQERGTALEGEAIENYSFQTGNETSPGGFFMTDDELIGASPDRIVGTSALLEAKVYAPPKHVLHMVLGFEDSEHRPQTQGQLFVAERDYGDLISHCPELPPIIARKGRDEKYIGLLRDALTQFCDNMLRRRDDLSARFGPFPLPKTKPFPPPPPGYGISDQDVEDYFKIVEQRNA